MELTRYTTIVYRNDHEAFRSWGDNLRDLAVKLLTLIDKENSSTYGAIINNDTQEREFFCRKVADE